MVLTPIKRKIRQNETYSISFTLRDSNRAPVDLTGYTSELMFRRTYDEKIPDLILVDTQGLTITPKKGNVRVDITAAQALALDVRVYFFDLFVISPTGERRCLAFGTYEVLPAATYPPNLS